MHEASDGILPFFNLRFPLHPLGQILKPLIPEDLISESSESMETSESVKDLVLYGLIGDRIMWIGVSGGLTGIGDWLIHFRLEIGDIIVGWEPVGENSLFVGEKRGLWPFRVDTVGEVLFLLAALMIFLAIRACMLLLALSSRSCPRGDNDLSLQEGDVGDGLPVETGFWSPG